MKPTADPKKSRKKSTKSANLFPVIGIGASAGGLDAFKKLIKTIPEDSGMAFVLVQHLDPHHESMLPEILQKETSVPVVEITDDIKVEPNHIYVIPSNKMMVARDSVLLLTKRPEKSITDRTLPIDLFFTSLAEVHQSHAIGVVLSGTGSDGTLGLKMIKDHGGITIAQEEASAAYNGMPHSAVQANVVDFILTPEKIPQKLIELCSNMDKSDEDLQNLLQPEEEVFKKILALLSIRKGVDFTYYKQTTVRRRILRRMALSKIDKLATYLKKIRENTAEQNILYQDLLIPVTAFFRDTDTFDYLCENVFPRIVENKAPGETIRVWVAGCSTGEEAYSIAMCFREILDDNRRVQIFASDLSEPAIAKARSGIYTKKEVEALMPKRLQKFFKKHNGNYLVNKNVRDMCVFAIHNLLKDPPFGKMDFISCRNVLIYMDPYLQKKALTTFHYALNPRAILLLGKTESITGVPELFAVVEKKDKLFSRKDGPGKYMHVASQRSEQSLSPIEAPTGNETSRTDFQKTADDIILRNYSPAGVVINETADIVHFRGKTGRFLEQSPGKPSHNLLKMAKSGLSFELRSILHNVKKQNAPVSKENITLTTEDGTHKIAIEALPLPNMIEPHYMILFHDSKSHSDHQSGSRNSIDKTAPSKSKSNSKDQYIQQLEQELEQKREDMHSIIEDQEAANEVLQTANEELLSSSEELQSLNEELETGKEELQSTNEELIVVNQEIFSLNEHVTEARDYAEAILANIREPLLVLDENLMVKTANNAFYKTFRVNEAETEGLLIYDIGDKQWNIPALRTLLEKILPEKSKIIHFEVTHTFSNIGKRVLLLNAWEVVNKNNKEKLILLSIEDNTVRSKILGKIEESEKRFRQMAELMPQKIWTADAAGNLNYLNSCWFEYTGLTFNQLKGWGWEKAVHPDDWPKTKDVWLRSLSTGDNFEVEHRFLNTAGIYKWHLTRGLAQKDGQGKITMWIGTDTEIQGQQELKQELERQVVDRTQEVLEANETLEEKIQELEGVNSELESFAYVSSHDLQEPLRKIQTFADRILEKENKNLSPKGKDYFQRMQSAANRMQVLIKDILTFSRVKTTEGDFEITDLKTIIEDVKIELKVEIDEKQVNIEADELGMAKIIPFQFRQLMQNLISNSIKFSKPGQRPHIVIKSSIVKGDTVKNTMLLPELNYCHISFSDNGIGFAPKFKDKIFEVFQKLHSRDEYPGTGIGLSIVKKIVSYHDGAITAKSTLNEGATFDIYIPED